MQNYLVQALMPCLGVIGRESAQVVSIDHEENVLC